MIKKINEHLNPDMVMLSFKFLQCLHNQIKIKNISELIDVFNVVLFDSVNDDVESNMINIVERLYNDQSLLTCSKKDMFSTCIALAKCDLINDPSYYCYELTFTDIVENTLSKLEYSEDFNNIDFETHYKTPIRISNLYRKDNCSIKLAYEKMPISFFLGDMKEEVLLMMKEYMRMTFEYICVEFKAHNVLFLQHHKSHVGNEVKIGETSFEYTNDYIVWTVDDYCIQHDVFPNVDANIYDNIRIFAMSIENSTNMIKTFVKRYNECTDLKLDQHTLINMWTIENDKPYDQMLIVSSDMKTRVILEKTLKIT